MFSKHFKWKNMLPQYYPIVACTTTSAWCYAKICIQRGRFCARSQDSAKTGHLECSSSRLCAASVVVASSSLKEVRRWLGWHLHSHPFVQDAKESEMTGLNDGWKSGGCLVMRRMSAFLTKLCQQMFRILHRHHWSNASISYISALLTAQQSDP